MGLQDKKLRLLAALCALQLAVACGDEDATTDKDAGDDAGHRHDHDHDAGDDPDGDDAGAAEPDPVYALATQVFGPSDETTYLITHQGSLFEGELRIEGGVERAGRGLTVAGLAPGSLFLAGDQNADVDLYDVTDGTLSKQDTVSFMGEGLDAIGEYPGQLVVLSETKALYFDSRTLKVIVWNPRAMTLTRAIDVSALKVEGFAATFSTLTVQRGDKVYMPVGYRTPASVPSAAAVVIVDTSNDTASIAKDERCGYVRDAVEGDDGMIYLATEAFGAAVHHLNESAAPAPCLLRFDTGSDTYDAEYMVALNELAGGDTVGSLIKLPNGKAYTRVLDESKVPEMETPSGRALASARAWTWSEITLGDEPALTPVAGGPLMGGSFIPLPLGDELVIPDFAEDLSSTTLCDMTAGPSCERGAQVDGLVFSVALLK